MMTRFRFINLFAILFSTTLVASVVTLFVFRRQLNLGSLFLLKIDRMPIFFFLLLLLLVLSFAISLLLYYGLRANQRLIVQKLQWLILGDYHHKVFQKSQKNVVLSDYLGVIDAQIDTLSEQLRELSSDLTDWSNEKRALTAEEKGMLIADERKRIARDLHDSVSQQLYATSMLLSTVVQSRDNEAFVTQQLEIIEKIVQDAQKELRAMLLHLRPISLENKNLSDGLRLLLSELRSKVSLEVIGNIADVSLPVIKEEAMFRIVQELISNMLRHSKATKFELYLLQENDRVKLRVIDNGIGFDTSQKSLSSFGLTGVRERVASMGGSINIVSMPYQGTSIDITIENGVGHGSKN